jgi:hypothetical protein
MLSWRDIMMVKKKIMMTAKKADTDGDDRLL